MSALTTSYSPATIAVGLALPGGVSWRWGLWRANRHHKAGQWGRMGPSLVRCRSPLPIALLAQ